MPVCKVFLTMPHACLHSSYIISNSFIKLYCFIVNFQKLNSLYSMLYCVENQKHTYLYHYDMPLSNINFLFKTTSPEITRDNTVECDALKAYL